MAMESSEKRCRLCGNRASRKTQEQSRTTSFDSTGNRPTTFGANSNSPTTFGNVGNQPTTFEADSNRPTSFDSTGNRPTSFGADTNRPTTFGNDGGQNTPPPVHPDFAGGRNQGFVGQNQQVGQGVNPEFFAGGNNQNQQGQFMGQQSQGQPFVRRERTVAEAIVGLVLALLFPFIGVVYCLFLIANAGSSPQSKQIRIISAVGIVLGILMFISVWIRPWDY